MFGAAPRPCSGMDVDLRPLGKNGCTMDVRSYLPPKKMDAHLDVAFLPPHAKMSCFVWAWHDGCLLNAELIAWHCRAVHTEPHSLQRPTRKADKGTPWPHSVCTPFPVQSVTGCPFLFFSNIHLYTPSIHFPSPASPKNGCHNFICLRDSSLESWYTILGGFLKL